MIDVKELKKYEPLYIIGHMKPDVDTIVSSYLLSNIFNHLGIASYPCVLNKGYEINKYNKNIIDDYFHFVPIVIDENDIMNHNFVLVDHNDPIQSIGSASNVVFGMDHHQNLNFNDNIIFSDLCSNSLFIYNYFKDIYSFNDKEKNLVLIASLTDTLFLKTDRCKLKDRALIDELGISFDSDELLNKYFIETDLSKGLSFIIENSDRDFSFFDVHFTSSVIYVKNSNNSTRMEYKNLIMTGDKNHLGMWSDLEENKTYVYFKLVQHKFEKEYNTVASRASTVMPDIINYLEHLYDDKKI